MQARITPVIDIKTFKKLQVFWISKKYLQDFPQEPLSSSQLVVLLVSQTFFVIGATHETQKWRSYTHIYM
jgi:hypothetical protein